MVNLHMMFALANLYRLYAKYDASELVFGIETADPGWLALHAHLLEKDFTVHIINPKLYGL